MEEGEGAPGPRAVEDRFIALWAGVADLGGLTPAHGRIQALLFLARRPLDAATIERRLGISHGSCSLGLHELLARGVVRRVNVPGLRRAKFAADPDGWKWLERCLREVRRRRVAPLLQGARETAALAEEEVRRAREERRPGVREFAATGARVIAFARFLEDLAALLDAFVALDGPPPARVLRALSRTPARPPRPGGKG